MTSQPLLSPDGLQWYDGSAWRSLLSPDGESRWNGSGWVALAGPAAPTTTLSRSRRLLLLIAGAGLAVLVLAAYLMVTALHPGLVFVSSGADSAAQFQAEMRYRTVYTRAATTVRRDSVPFAATATSPGVCNRGGSKQNCFDTDVRVQADLQALLRDIGQVPTPDRYRVADADLKAGLRLTIEALTLRNQAIASNDPNASFAASNQSFSAGLALLEKAAREFPVDSRPEPSLV